jgi:hypothetical protein
MNVVPYVKDFRLDTYGPIPDSRVERIISENLLPRLESIAVWMASSRGTLNFLGDQMVSRQRVRGDICINLWRYFRQKYFAGGRGPAAERAVNWWHFNV